MQDFVLPANLAAGRYLIRQEIIAHHESDTAFNINPARGAQFYPSCVQVEVTGSGTAVPDQNFNFNTGYTYADPGIVFNLYQSISSYKIPGPEVWTASGSSPAPSPSNPAVTTSSLVIPGPTVIPGEPETTSTTAIATATTTAAPTTLVTVTSVPSTQRPVPTRCPGRRRRSARRANRV